MHCQQNDKIRTYIFNIDEVSNVVLITVWLKRLEHRNIQGILGFHIKVASRISAHILVQMLAMINDERGTPVRLELLSCYTDCGSDSITCRRVRSSRRMGYTAH